MTLFLHHLDSVNSKQQIGYRNEGWISRGKKEKHGCFGEIATLCEQSRLPFVALTDLTFPLLLFTTRRNENRILPTYRVAGFGFLIRRKHRFFLLLFLIFFLASYPSLSLLNDSSPQSLSSTNSGKLAES